MTTRGKEDRIHRILPRAFVVQNFCLTLYRVIPGRVAHDVFAVGLRALLNEILDKHLIARRNGQMEHRATIIV